MELVEIIAYALKYLLLDTASGLISLTNTLSGSIEYIYDVFNYNYNIIDKMYNILICQQS